MIRLPRPQFISQARALKNVIEQLQDVSLLAIDTESNSMFVYQEQVCLIQLSARRETNGKAQVLDFIIDPLAIPDVSALGELFANPAIEKVFHAADYDITCMKRDFGFEFVNIFDTYFAAQTLGWTRVGLSSLLEEHFSVALDKRFQQAEWHHRPLSLEELQYAQMDTHFLPALRDIQLNELQRSGYLEEAQEGFRELASLPATDRSFDPEGFWRLKGAYLLTGSSLAILRQLYLWREKTAQKRDIPSTKVISDSTLVDIATICPLSTSALQRIPGITRQIVKRDGKAILETVARGKNEIPPRRNPQSRTSPEVIARYEALHTWRKEKALSRGVESNVILSKNALWVLALRHPKTEEELAVIQEIGPHRRAKYGNELLNLLKGV
ncbi:MAG: HRDC domain-containing protein [Anaerolineae bacterium]|nr:HRDC domain-containing protein [Anaerolineae bacterium]